MPVLFMGGSQSRAGQTPVGPDEIIGNAVARCPFRKLAMLGEMGGLVRDSVRSTCSPAGAPPDPRIDAVTALVAVGQTLSTMGMPLARLRDLVLVDDAFHQKKAGDWPGSRELEELFNDTYDEHTDRFSAMSDGARARHLDAMGEVHLAMHGTAPASRPQSMSDIPIPAQLPSAAISSGAFAHYARCMCALSLERNAILSAAEQISRELIGASAQGGTRFHIVAPRSDDAARLLTDAERLRQRASSIGALSEAARLALVDVMTEELAASADARSLALTEAIVSKRTAGD